MMAAEDTVDPPEDPADAGPAAQGGHDPGDDTSPATTSSPANAPGPGGASTVRRAEAPRPAAPGHRGGRARRRRRWVPSREALSLAAVVVVVAAAVIVGVGLWLRSTPPTEAELAELAGLRGKSELLIGVKDDVPGVALRDPATGSYSGFDIDIAYLVADDLGFRRDEVRFLPIETEDRARMQARDGNRFVTVDLVVATYSITPEREALPGVQFAGPYLLTEQSVLTRVDHPSVSTLADLKGETVCSLATSTSETPAAKAGAAVVGKNRISQCVDGLLNRQYDAVTTDAAMLAGFVALRPKELRLDDIGLDPDESWGINTGTNSALQKLVQLSLYRSATDPGDDRWERAFETFLRPEQPASGAQQVAQSCQPRVAPVEIRQWPWEDGGPGPDGRPVTVDCR